MHLKKKRYWPIGRVKRNNDIWPSLGKRVIGRFEHVECGS